LNEDTSSQLGQLGIGYQRSTDDASTALARAQREGGQFGIDTQAQKAFQAAQSGYEAPAGPKNEFVGPKGNPYRIVRRGGVDYYVARTGRSRRRGRPDGSSGSRSRFITQAQQDAIVRFGPEISGLKALIAEAQQEKRSGIAVGAVDGPQRHERDQPGDARGRAGVPRGGRDAEGGGCPGAGGRRGTAGPESERSLRLSLLSARARGPDVGLAGGSVDGPAATQKVSARRGQQFAVQRARSDFASSVAKVLQRNTDLAREQGAFIISEAGKSRQEAAQRRQQMRELSMRLSQQERASIRSSGIDPVTGGLTQDAKTKQQALRSASRRRGRRRRRRRSRRGSRRRSS
jgi:hypothetical protein